MLTQYSMIKLNKIEAKCISFRLKQLCQKNIITIQKNITIHFICFIYSPSQNKIVYVLKWLSEALERHRWQWRGRHIPHNRNRHKKVMFNQVCNKIQSERTYASETIMRRQIWLDGFSILDWCDGDCIFVLKHTEMMTDGIVMVL